MSSTQDLGLVTAYGYAVEGGYTGTEAEFKTLLGQQQTYHDEAVQAAEDAEAYAAQAMSGTPDGYASLVSTVNSLNSALTLTSVTYSPLIEGLSGNLTIRKYGRLCWATFSVSGASAFSAMEVGAQVYTITDDAYKPLATVNAMSSGRTTGQWSLADYYDIMTTFSIDGSMTFRGKASELQACMYVTCCVSYISAQ